MVICFRNPAMRLSCGILNASSRIIKAPMTYIILQDLIAILSKLMDEERLGRYLAVLIADTSSDRFSSYTPFPQCLRIEIYFRNTFRITF